MSIISDSVIKFMDDNFTIFTKGSYVIGDNVYEYKLEDANGEDYCTKEQLILWDVIVTAVLEMEEM